jgi:tetratricopeptide (TPR) repeat protein
MGARRAIWIVLLLTQFSWSCPGQANAAAAQIRESFNRIEELRKQGEYQESLQLANTTLRQAESLEDDALITEALYQLSLVHYFLESFEDARAYMDIGLTHARLYGFQNLEADLLNAQGVLEWKQGNLFEATAKLENALQLRQGLQQWVSMASIANNLGIIAYSQHRYDKAVEHYRQGLEWLGTRANDRMRASLYSNLAESLIPLGQYAEAERLLVDSLAIEENANEPLGLAYTYFNLGELRSAQGDPEAAITLYRHALEIQLSMDSNWSAALTRLRMAREFLAGGDTAAALAELEPGYTAVKRINALTLLRDYTSLLADIHEAKGDAELARYYRELRDWHSSRIESADQTGSPTGAFRPTSRLPGAPATDERNLSLVRIAILSLLLVLVAFLLVENIRLRRQSNKAGASGESVIKR